LPIFIREAAIGIQSSSSVICATEHTSGIPIHLLPDPAFDSRVFDTTWPVHFGDSEPAMFFRCHRPAVEISDFLDHRLKCASARSKVLGGKKKNESYCLLRLVII
jgi:hypothetical protein